MAVNATPNGDDRLRVQVSARSTAGQPTNYVSRVRFDTSTNARFDIGPGTDKTVPYAHNALAGAQSLTFYISRVSPGQATTLNFVVTDSCGDWPTFAGGAPGAF